MYADIHGLKKTLLTNGRKEKSQYPVRLDHVLRFETIANNDNKTSGKCLFAYVIAVVMRSGNGYNDIDTFRTSRREANYAWKRTNEIANFTRYVNEYWMTSQLTRLSILLI